MQPEDKQLSLGLLNNMELKSWALLFFLLLPE